MKVLYNWLKEFVELTAAPEELRTRLSLSGTAVEALEQTAAGPMLDAELTSNRADCLGHYGIAREAAALYRLPLKHVEPHPRETSEQTSIATRAQIDAPELCGRYTARVLRGVKVGPSPDWLRQRLEALGQASINNVVDATNYVMLELGHPLHAFDMDLLAEKRIVVRRARAGEKMHTLDGIERTLTNEMCVIADATRAVAIAGIMGGAESEIRSTSRNLLLESACFDPISIRRTSKALGLRTEASMRFERGADLEMAETASRRCAELIQQLCGGEVLAGAVDIYPGRSEAPVIVLTRRELLRVMGADVPGAEIEAILEGLGFEPMRADAAHADADSPAAAWACRRPSWRGDVTREVDLIEEVARIYGVDKFPARLPAAKLPAARLEYAEADDRLREILIGLGYQEIITIPIVDEPSDTIFRTENAAPARIANPLAEDASVMRSTGAITMARTLEWNLNHGQRNVRLFEFGKTYGWNGTQPVETRVVTLGASGLAREKGVAESERAYAFADLKGDLDQIGHLAGGFVWESGRTGMASRRARGNDFAANQWRVSYPCRSSDMPDNFLGAFLSDLSCDRTPTLRSWNWSRCARATNRRERPCATSRFHDFRRWNAIFLWWSRMEPRLPASKMPFALLVSRKFPRLMPWIYFAARICRRENSLCLSA